MNRVSMGVNLNLTRCETVITTRSDSLIRLAHTDTQNHIQMDVD